METLSLFYILFLFFISMESFLYNVYLHIKSATDSFIFWDFWSEATLQHTQHLNSTGFIFKPIYIKTDIEKTAKNAFFRTSNEHIIQLLLTYERNIHQLISLVV